MKRHSTHPSNAGLRTNSRTRDFIRHEEGLRLEAYQCPAGVWTIGYGHTSDSRFVVRPRVWISEEYAEELFAHDVHEAEERVKAEVAVPLNRNQFSALVSFVFNRGSLHYRHNGAVRPSTLLIKLNTGDYLGAADEFPRWVYAREQSSGKLRQLPGLVRRRERERDEFLRPVSFSLREFLRGIKLKALELIE